MCVEDTISPATSTSGTTRASKASWRRSRSASPMALCPKRKFSPTETRSAPRRSTSTLSTNSCAPWAAKERLKGMTTSSRTPRPATRSALTSSEVSSLGAASGATTARGCGSKVSTVSAPSITSRWPRWTPSNSPTATWRGRGSASGSQVTFMSSPSAAEAYGGLQRAVRPRLGDGDQAVVVEEADEAFRVPRDRSAVGGPAGRGRVQTDGGQERERLVQRQDALRVGRRDLEGADRGAAQRVAIGVAEVGDERAHVGARGALDHERRPVLLAAGELEARDLDLALGQLDRLARAGQRVGAPPRHLDRRVGGRALADAAGRQPEGLYRRAPGRELAVAVARGRNPAQPRDSFVALGQRHEEALNAGGAAH